MSDALKIGDLLVRGNIMALITKTDPSSRRTTHTVQVMKRTGKDSFELLNVKLFDGADPTRFKTGDAIEVAVDISTFEGQVYYRATRDLLNRSTERTAPGASSPKSN